MIFVGPRHGKSMLSSRYFPGWFLGWWPTRRATIASYAQSLALDRGFECRNDLQEHGMQAFGIQLDQRRKAASQFAISGHQGEFRAVGVGSGLTGTGADVLVIDDPFKDSQEAGSIVIREKVWQWYLSTASTRLMPGGACVLIMTRWNDDDLAGRLLKRDPTRDKHGRKLPDGARRTPDEGGEGDEWEVICLPSLAEDWEKHPMMDGPDPLGREVGEALWPEQFPAVRLAHIRGVDRYWFTAMHQQRPAEDEGGIFKAATFRYYQWVDKTAGLLEFRRGDAGRELGHAPDVGDTTLIDLAYCTLFQTADTAATEETYSDWTVISTWAVTPERELLLLDVAREKIDTTKQTGWAVVQYDKHRPAWVGIEDKTFGLALFQQLRVAGYPCRQLKADRDKISRASVAGVLCENGRVYFPAHADWLEDWEMELKGFPNWAHDDQVDTFGYAAIELPKITVGEVSAGSDRPVTEPLGHDRVPVGFGREGGSAASEGLSGGF